ncbi:hypothetical protein D3C72_1123290 [compost metagenome]
MQAEELLVPKPRHDPALDDLHRHLGLGFVLGLTRPRRQHHRVVMPGALQRRPVQARLVAIGVGDQGARVVRHDHLADPAKVAERLAQRGQPVHLGFPGRGAGIGVVRGPQRCDEDMRPADLAGGRIDHRQRRAGIVDEQLLAGPVLLAHRAFEGAGVAAVVLDELGIAVGRLLGMGGDVLLPQQLQGDALAPQFAVDSDQIRQHPLTARVAHLGGGQQCRRQRDLIQRGQRRPLQACLAGRRDVLADDALGQLQGPGDLLVREASLKLEAQTFFDITHGYSLRRHSSTPQKRARVTVTSGHAQRGGRISLSRDRRFR